MPEETPDESDVVALVATKVGKVETSGVVGETVGAAVGAAVGARVGEAVGVKVGGDVGEVVVLLGAFVDFMDLDLSDFPDFSDLFFLPLPTFNMRS